MVSGKFLKFLTLNFLSVRITSIFHKTSAVTADFLFHTLRNDTSYSRILPHGTMSLNSCRSFFTESSLTVVYANDRLLNQGPAPPQSDAFPTRGYQMATKRTGKALGL